MTRLNSMPRSAVLHPRPAPPPPAHSGKGEGLGMATLESGWRTLAPWTEPSEPGNKRLVLGRYVQGVRTGRTGHDCQGYLTL